MGDEEIAEGGAEIGFFGVFVAEVGADGEEVADFAGEEAGLSAGGEALGATGGGFAGVAAFEGGLGFGEDVGAGGDDAGGPDAMCEEFSHIGTGVEAEEKAESEKLKAEAPLSAEAVRASLADEAERYRRRHGAALDPDAWFREFQRINDATNARLDRMDVKGGPVLSALDVAERVRWATQFPRFEVPSADLRLFAKPDADGNWWELLRPVRVLLCLDPISGKQVWLEIPAGPKSDLASVPKALWWLISPFEIGLPGLLHDFLYYRNMMDRVVCDAIFRTAMRHHCDPRIVPAWKQEAAFRAVRAFGAEGYARAGRNLRAAIAAGTLQVDIDPVAAAA